MIGVSQVMEGYINEVFEAVETGEVIYSQNAKEYMLSEIGDTDLFDCAVSGVTRDELSNLLEVEPSKLRRFVAEYLGDRSAPEYRLFVGILNMYYALCKVWKLEKETPECRRLVYLLTVMVEPADPNAAVWIP